MHIQMLPHTYPIWGTDSPPDVQQPEKHLVGCFGFQGFQAGEALLEGQGPSDRSGASGVLRKKLPKY